ncbi:archease [Desulfococcaceae bacterium HSG8]|nr:archease [Desulfococcaceae bacterium HSG8]
MRYQLTDHTADIGVLVSGADLGELFENAVYAMSDIITDIRKVQGKKTHEIHITGDDWPDLMVNWLREILFLWAGRELLVKSAEVLRISEYELTAKLDCESYDPDRHFIKNEIKAVTYHQIKVCAEPGGWKSEIIFDA